MIYPMNLDEYADSVLLDELSRRQTNREDGVCDYCERRTPTPSCRFPVRHALAMVRAAKPKKKGARK